jgi:flagellin-like hook-associated protein FlgL
LNLTTSLSGIQDADVANLAIQISSTNMAYQAALQTTASIRQTSLLNYLSPA